MKKLAAFLIAAALVVLALIGVRKVSEKENNAEEVIEVTEKQQTVSLNIAYMPNYAALWAVLTGIDQGYFADEGLDLQLYEFADGPTEIAAMESGSIDLAYIGHGAHKLCITGSAKIFAPQQINTSDYVIGLKSHGVEKLEDLKGKKVAYASGTSSEASLRSALEKVNLSFDDIEAYEMEVGNMVSAMASGTIDACATWSPYTMQITTQIDDAVKIEFENGTTSLASWIALPDYAEQNRDVLVRFSKALYKAMDFGSKEENYEYVAGLVAKQTATDLEVNLFQTEDAEWFNSEKIKTGLEDGTLKDDYVNQQQTFLNAGAIEKEVPLEDYILFDVIEEALR
ncbi:MAG: ABC transporter substrate-binding protein [Lachnospiraceae bacterium]|nr:ABC transporter substrate-binding protein [Lachnospiraceae bacterium]